jgi:hypothetical protein
MDPFQRYLGLQPVASSNNLYRVIGVDEGEKDPERLKLAIQKTGLKLKQADRAADPEGWKIVVEELKRAQQILLNEELNSKYLKELRSKSNHQPTSSNLEAPSILENGASLGDLTPWLPTGDPNSGLDVSQLMATQVGVMTAPWFAPAESRMQSLRNELSNAVSTSVSHAELPSSFQSSRAPARKPFVRKKSALERAMPMLLLFGGALALLGIGGGMLYMSQMKKEQLAQLEKENQQNPDGAQANKGNGASDPVMGNLVPSRNGDKRKKVNPKESGLPGVNEDGTKLENPVLPEIPTPPKNEMAQPEMKPEPAPVAPENPPANPTPPTPDPTTPTTPENPQPETPKPDGNMSDMVKDADKKPEMKEPTEPAPKEPTVQEWKDYSEAMNLARKSLQTRAFPKFETSLEKASPLAITANQKKQWQRLQIFGQAVKQYQEALLSSIAARTAGENITVKNTTVAWIEGSGDKFKVRVAGSSKTYALQTAPLGLTNALVDLVLAPDQPTTQLAKASVAMLSAKTADETAVTTWIDAAVAAGLIDGDFRLVTSESYEPSDGGGEPEEMDKN